MAGDPLASNEHAPDPGPGTTNGSGPSGDQRAPRRRLAVLIGVALLTAAVAGSIATFVFGGENTRQVAGGVRLDQSPAVGPTALVSVPPATSSAAPGTPSAAPASPSPPSPVVHRVQLRPMAGVAGTVFVGNADGTVTLIRSPKNRSSTKVADQPIQMVVTAFDGGAWAMVGSPKRHDATLRKISQNEHVAHLPFPTIDGIAVVGDRAWVLEGDTMTPIDLSKDTIGDPIATPHSPVSIVAGTRVFVASESEIRQYKPNGESVGDPAEIPTIVAMATTPSGPAAGLWVATPSDLIRVDPITMVVGRSRARLPGPPIGLASTRNAVWLLFADAQVWAVGRSGATSLRTSLGNAHPVGFAAQGNNAYVLTSDGTIYAINAEDGPKHGTIKAFANTPCDHC